ncbi:MAG: exodeoxyribonuclease VII large subunit [Gammaproteobacteria bacterium]|nr:exodeoxyribonuclease VII large subunit [Gammaproteobacteria bacterium]
MDRIIYEVSEFTDEARALIESEFNPVWLTGEISNLATPASGHLYFSLKDDHAQVRCAMFRNRRRPTHHEIANGDAVLLSGKASIYTPRGDFQVIVDYIEPAGEGELRRRYDLLRKKLEREGLFDSNLKKSVPDLPKRISVITSPSGAALQDILVTLARRFPLAHVIHLPVPVQGENAVPEIVNAFGLLKKPPKPDVVVLARGGGSLEDLWAFNEEAVVRAIHACNLPVVTGIGHETDVTLADFAADLRAPTPTAAAESVSPDCKMLAKDVSNFQTKMLDAMQSSVQLFGQRIDNASSRLRHPRERLNHQQQTVTNSERRIKNCLRHTLDSNQNTLDNLNTRLMSRSPEKTLKFQSNQINGLAKFLKQQLERRLQLNEKSFDVLAAKLKTLSPTATLARGFSIVRAKNGKRIVRSAEQLKKGATVIAEFAEGTVTASVEAVELDQPGEAD